MASKKNVPPPSYDDVFHPPQKKNRENGKLYGKKLLEVHWEAQHKSLLDNYRIVRGWFKNKDFPQDLRHKKDESEKIDAIIKEHYEHIKVLEFGDSVKFKWREEDIRSWWIASNASARKYKKTKSQEYASKTLEVMITQDNEHPCIKNVEKDDLNQNEVLSPIIENVKVENATTKMTTSKGASKEQCFALNSLSQENVFCKEVLKNEEGKLDLLWKMAKQIEYESHDEEEDNAFDNDIYDDVLNGSQFPCFEDMIRYGSQAKRVKASHNIEDDANEPIVEKLNFMNTLENCQCDSIHFNEEALGQVRKSTRERKISEKLKNNMEKKVAKTPILSKVKKLKDIKNIEDKRVDLLKAQHPPCKVSSLSNEDKDTILLKYFELKTLDDMYMVLKASYYKIKRGEKFFKEDEKNLSLYEMRDNLVAWLFFSSKVVLNRQDGHELTIDEVNILA